MNERIIPGAEPFSFDGGPTGVLLLHGFTGNPISMRGWGEALAERGYAVLCPRLPGHGTSWQDLARRRGDEWTDEVDRALTTLRSSCDQVVVGALSFGGALALDLVARRGDEVRGLVLVNPYLRDRRHALLPVARMVMRSVPGTGNDIKRPGPDEMSYQRIPLHALGAASRLMKVARDALPSIRQPLLVLHSPEDHVIPRDNGPLVIELAGSERKELVPLTNSYHVATMDNDAGLIVEKTDAFIRSLVAA
jgi:carboxylesterase